MSYQDWLNGTWNPLRRVENFDYPDGTRFWDAYDQGFEIAGGHPFFTASLARYGSPLETDGNGHAVIGRGPYIPGTWQFDFSAWPAGYADALTDFYNRFTGWGAGLTTGVRLLNFDDNDGYPSLYIVSDKRSEFYEVGLSAGSPGPYGTGILRPYGIRLFSNTMQVCWSQAGGIWAEFVKFSEPGDEVTYTPSEKIVVPLASPSSEARTLGIRATGNFYQPHWDFSINGVIVAKSVSVEGVVTNNPDLAPVWISGWPEEILMDAFVVNPVPPEQLVPWGTRPRDFEIEQLWGGSPEYTPPPPGSPIYYYPGERYPVFDWMHTWHDFIPYQLPAPATTKPPLHQSRADFLAAGGAYRYRTARTRQASIWQNAHL